MAYDNVKFIRKENSKNYEVMINGEYVGDVGKYETATRSYWHLNYNPKYKVEIMRSEDGYQWDKTRIGAVLEYFFKQVCDGEPLELKNA